MNWYGVRDSDPRAVALYSRHYSSKKAGKEISDWLRYGFSGPGETMLLLTQDCRALFGWIKNTIDRRDHQVGVNCFVFRNEGSMLSSELIREASILALERWPGQRLWTYVNPGAIASTNPGFCFKQAGWHYIGLSGQGLHILEMSTT